MRHLPERIWFTQAEQRTPKVWAFSLRDEVVGHFSDTGVIGVRQEDGTIRYKALGRSPRYRKHEVPLESLRINTRELMELSFSHANVNLVNISPEEVVVQVDNPKVWEITIGGGDLVNFLHRAVDAAYLRRDTTSETHRPLFDKTYPGGFEPPTPPFRTLK